MRWRAVRKKNGGKEEGEENQLQGVGQVAVWERKGGGIGG